MSILRKDIYVSVANSIKLLYQKTSSDKKIQRLNREKNFKILRNSKNCKKIFEKLEAANIFKNSKDVNR